jgi:hypothetical protein
VAETFSTTTSVRGDAVSQTGPFPVATINTSLCQQGSKVTAVVGSSNNTGEQVSVSGLADALDTDNRPCGSAREAVSAGDSDAVRTSAEELASLLLAQPPLVNKQHQQTPPSATKSGTTVFPSVAGDGVVYVGVSKKRPDQIGGSVHGISKHISRMGAGSDGQ